MPRITSRSIPTKYEWALEFLKKLMAFNPREVFAGMMRAII